MATSPAPARCARADCTALREELALVRGDLLELEGEGEALHERVAALEAERGGARRDREALEADNRRLSALVQSLTERLEAAVSAREAVPVAEDAAKRQAAQVESESEDERERLRERNAALERQLGELRMAASEASKTSKEAVEQSDRAAQEGRDKRGELYKALRENEELRAELLAARSALRSATDKAAAYEETVRGLHAQLEDYCAAVDEQTLEITQLHAKFEQIEQEKSALEGKLVEMDEQETDVEALTQQTRAAFELERAAMTRKLERLKTQVDHLKATNAQQQQQQLGRKDDEASLQRPRASSARPRAASLDADEGDAREVNKQLELLQELRIRDKNTILELNQRILQQQSDLESLAEHVATSSGQSNTIEAVVQAALAKESSGRAAIQAENAKMARRLKEQGTLVRDLEARQGELERQLREANERNEQYERGAGLEDAMKYQKQLRKELDKQQQANIKLRDQLNVQMEAAGRLHTSFERLKAETGRSPTFQYDELVVAEHLQGQVAVHRAVMAQMELQVQELEAERVRLLQRLRDQARVAGNKLYETHGLTIEQWEVVEEFMDQLKRAPEVANRVLQGNICPRDKSVEEDRWDLVTKAETETSRLTAEVSRLLGELEAAKVEVAAGRVIAAGSQTRDFEGPEENLVASLRDTIRELQADCDGLKSELESTKLALEKEISVSASKIPNDSHGECKKVNRAKRGVGTRGTQTVDAPIQDLIEASKKAAVMGPIRKDPEEKQQGTSLQEVENSAESIAQTVVKALEAQLEMLKQATLAAQGKPSTPSTTAGSTPVSSVAAPSDTHKSAHPSARSRTPRDRSNAVNHSSGETSMDASPDSMTLATDEDLTKHIDCLKELNVCLDELTEAEAREEALGVQLQDHEHAFQSLMDQHTMLYAHFFHMHAQYTAAETKLRRERDHLETSSREWEIKCQRLEAGMHAIGGLGTCSMANEDAMPSDAQLKAQITHLTRQMAAYEVNDARWKRTCRLLQDELRASERRNAVLENEWLEMEKTLKFRIVYLESWKQGADDMMERMDKALDASILKKAADRQQHALVDILCKYRDVSRAYADVRVKYLELYDLPIQLSKSQHSLKLLEAEKRAREGPGGESGTTRRKNQSTNSSRAGSVDSVMQSRISELELELKRQVDRVKELESERANKFEELESGETGPQNWQKALVVTAIDDRGWSGGSDNALVAENELLYERVNEVEQLYETLTRECTKYKDVATLAASQANLLSKKLLQTKRDRQDESTRRRQLASASEDQALVGHLQLELMQLRTTYQQFTLKHDLVVESQQRALLERQQVELEAEKSAKELAEVRDSAREKVNKLEAALTQVSTRDLTARNAKWDAFRKRLDTLEDDLRAEHSRRKQLELELEEKMQRSANTSGTGVSVAAMTEVNRLRTRVEELETRERALIAQLEAVSVAASNSARAETREKMLEAELEDTKTLSEDLLRQVQAEQSRVAALLEQLGALERDNRELRLQKEDVELELRQRLQQLECEDNQRQDSREEGSPGSPLMRKKVGLYEQDQAQLQQAAQATIASLKQLVEDKNELVREYQQKLASVRAEVAQGKAQDRADASKLHKQLYEENQRVIAQLQDATATIRQLERSGKDKRALQAAQERHEHVLRSWKQSELALEESRQKIRELQAALDATINDRDLAEARAGEALEEIVTLQSNAEERARFVSQLEQRVGAARGELRKKDDKLQLLRDAIIKLKEEFLKAEDRNAIELARAQHALAASQLNSGRRRKKEEEHEEEQDAWQDEKQRLEAQVKILQDKLSLERSRSGRKSRQQRPSDEEEKQGDGDDKKARKLEAEIKAQAKEADVLKRELERLKTAVKEQAVSHARMVEELEKKLKVVQAQNAALREAAKPIETDAAGLKAESRLRDELAAAEETVNKQKRRVETLTTRLKELQEAIGIKDEELSASKLRVERLENDLKRRRDLPSKEKRPVSDCSAAMTAKWKAQATDLERQNAFLHETLMLKRNEWEDALRDQMERYEQQVKRLRERLACQLQAGDDGSVDESLHREESQFLVTQAMREELVALGEDLRTCEQQIMVKDTKLLEHEIELETLRVECQRLQRLSSSPTRPAESSKPYPTRPTAAKNDLHERAALEQLIENMKKVIEKLRSENDRLRRSAASSSGGFTPEQMERVRKQLREHKGARERLETQVEQLQRELNDLKKQKLRLQHKLRGATAPPSAFAADKRLEEKDAQLRVAERALTESNAMIEQREDEFRRLQDEYASLRLEVQSPVASNDRDKHLIEELQDQVTALEDENTRLTSELAAFDGEFFEEIEDLKYKYAQAVRDKRALERELQRLAR